MTERVKNTYEHLHATLHKRKNWKRNWARVYPGAHNYARLKPGHDDVVQLGYMHQPMNKLKGDRYYKRLRDDHQFAQMYVMLELHSDHALLGLNYGQSQKLVFDWPAIAKARNLDLDQLDCSESYTLRSDNVDITLNNLIRNYLCLPICHSGAHLQTLRRFQWWQYNKPMFKTCGPVRYNYNTGQLVSVWGDYTKQVNEPARLELNRSIRKAVAKIRALSQFSDGIGLGDLRAHLAKQLTSSISTEDAETIVNRRTDPNTVLESLEKMSLDDKTSVHDAMLNLSLVYTKINRAWRLHFRSQSVAHYINDTVVYTLQLNNTNSANLVWLRQYLQLGLGVVDYRPE